jgi:hypothetical protein
VRILHLGRHGGIMVVTTVALNVTKTDSLPSRSHEKQ